jgi:hypothetical protein
MRGDDDAESSKSERGLTLDENPIEERTVVVDQRAKDQWSMTSRKIV